MAIRCQVTGILQVSDSSLTTLTLFHHPHGEGGSTCEGQGGLHHHNSFCNKWYTQQGLASTCCLQLRCTQSTHLCACKPTWPLRHMNSKAVSTKGSPRWVLALVLRLQDVVCCSCPLPLGQRLFSSFGKLERKHIHTKRGNQLHTEGDILPRIWGESLILMHEEAPLHHSGRIQMP